MMNSKTPARGEPTGAVPEPAGLVSSAQAARLGPASRTVQAGPPQGQAVALTPMALARALRRRSALALGVALLLAGTVGAATWFLVPPSPFKAEARLHVASQAPKILFQTVETQNGGSDYSRYQSTQKTLVKSRLVLSAALRDPKVRGYQLVRDNVDPIEWLEKNLRVEFLVGSEVMEISLVGNVAEEVAGLVNAVKEAYMNEVVNVDLKRRIERHDKLKNLKGQYEELLKKRRQTMRKLAEAAGSDDRQTLALRQQYAMEHQHFLETELLGVQSQKRKLEAQLEASPTNDAERPAAEPEPASEQEIDRLVDEHPAVADVATQYIEKRRKLDVEWTKVRRIARNPNDEPSIRSLSEDVKGLGRLLARRRREVRPEVIRSLRSGGAAEEGAKGQEIGRDLAMLAQLEQRLNNELKLIANVNHELTSNTLDLQSDKDDVAQMELATAKIAQEVEALNVELDAPPRIRLIDHATVPPTRDDKKRYMMVGMLTFGSFFGGLFGIALLELQVRRVDTSDEVPVELGLSVVGALPRLPARNHRRGVAVRQDSEKDRYWRDVLLESVDATRTLLLHAARTGSYRVMMITSAVGGEGKTSLATYLSTSLAGSGLRVLLIDADLRRPMMHKLFDRPPTPGLSEVLRGEVDVDDAATETAVEGLSLLTAGQCDRQTLRILSQGGIAPLFDRLKEQFDFVLIDSSPILPVADAMLILQHVDAALFSIFRDVSRKPKVKEAFERLQRLGVPVLGAVVTGVHGGAYGQGYYGGYAYPGLPDSAAASSDELG